MSLKEEIQKLMEEGEEKVIPYEYTSQRILNLIEKRIKKLLK